ncbi:hypothetical protein C5167_024111 [Papaver somniferum]|uniref:LOB domain-containing protein n=1 Tax=Papaver somniferum TaxID=3469 RepID=A0A4Y7JQQ9_PAPSO|nr:LOB domain-containing protein 16-like [Papaver somniferum]RZC62362.1 hypothetical protein C5167_024111 [Papaver somniferum]
MATGNGGGSGSPCGACKFLRRKCASDCVFAPYFCSEQGPARFAAIHKVFGASNVSKLLLHVPVPDRCEAVVTIAYEAQARVRDPVYGCVAHIFALQQQVACLQAQLMQAKSQLVNKVAADTRSSLENHNWMENVAAAAAVTSQHMSYPATYMRSSVSPQSSLESVDNSNCSNNIDISSMQGMHYTSSDRDSGYNTNDHLHSYQPYNKKRMISNNELGELQALALRMMRNDF